MLSVETSCSSAKVLISLNKTSAIMCFPPFCCVCISPYRPHQRDSHLRDEPFLTKVLASLFWRLIHHDHGVLVFTTHQRSAGRYCFQLTVSVHTEVPELLLKETFLSFFLLQLVQPTLADLRGAPEGVPPRPNFFIFMQFSVKK